MRCVRNKPATHGGKRMISEGVMFKPGKCTLERGWSGRQDPFCLGPPNTPALLQEEPPPRPPPACINTRQGCRGPQDLPCARPIKRLIRHCLSLRKRIVSSPLLMDVQGICPDKSFSHSLSCTGLGFFPPRLAIE